MQNIRRIVSPPTFTDEVKQLKARILYIILLLLLLSAVVVIGVSALFGSTHILLIVSCGLLPVLLSLFLTRRGQLEGAAFLILLSLMGIIFLLQYFGQGVHDIAMMLYPVVIILAALLLNRWLFWLITAVSIFINGIIVTLELTGQLLNDTSPGNPAADLVFIALILSVLAIAMRQLVTGLWQYLEQARQNERALLQSNRVLEIQKVTLQKSEEEARYFQEKLQALHEVGFELANAQSLPELYRMVIELGRGRLGFDRLGLLLYDEETKTMVGTFGTDDDGHLRDERYFKQELKSEKIFNMLAEKTRLGFWAGNSIVDNGVVIGEGWNAMAIMWHGDRGIGWLATDNYIRKEPPTQMQLDLLTLYAGTVGYLINVFQAETNMQKYAQELERSNRELQDFAFVSSHDLQEPLRKIQAFSDRLMHKYSDVLDERGVSYLERMQNAAVRMQTLIQDVLAFSRVNSVQMPFTKVNLEEIIQGVVSDLELQIEELAAKIIIEPLPTIEADGTQMRQLFQNIISNALKFHQPNVPPVIRVSAQELIEFEQAFTMVLVEDNGIGFDAQYVGRIFGMFQRLNSKSKFEGSGVGLAVCKRIVERHNGRIEAESEKAVGSKFMIILPVRQPTHDSYRVAANN